MVERCADAKKSNRNIWKFRRDRLLALLDLKNSTVNTTKQILVILTFGIFLGCTVKPSENKRTQEAEVNELPEMVITLLDNSRLDVKKLSSGAILIFFQPECDHCQHAAKAISENLTALAKTELYFITSQPLEMSEKFSEEYKLAGHSNIHFGLTTTEEILGNYGPIATPSAYIYSAGGRLIKSFNGEVKIEELLKYI